MLTKRNTLSSIAYLILDARGKFDGGNDEPSIHDISVAVLQAASCLDTCGDTDTVAAEAGAVVDLHTRHVEQMRLLRLQKMNGHAVARPRDRVEAHFRL